MTVMAIGLQAESFRHLKGSTENAGPELGGPNKTKGRNIRVKNGGPILNTGKCKTGNCRTGKCRTGKRRTKKRAGGTEGPQSLK